MREILFRGKGDRKYNSGNWYHGYLSKDCDGDYVITEIGFSRTVIPETVGQFTGLTDKNGKKIFEGDIIQSVETGETGIVQWLPEYSAFMVWCRSSNEIGFLYECSSIMEVVGNAHDNSELLKGE